MENKIIPLPRFESEAKRLIKKHRSFAQDLRNLVEELKSNALLGVSLGGNLRKIRLPIGSKGVGKSGGARLISYVALVQETVYLLTVYDKSETETVPLSDLRQLAKSIHK